MGISSDQISMRGSTAAAWGIAFLSLLTLGQWLRAEPPPSLPALDFLLGVWPNFTAVGAVAFVGASSYVSIVRSATGAVSSACFLVCLICSVAGLAAWECLQVLSGGRLIFDLWDLSATLSGAVIAWCCFRAFGTKRA